MQRKTMKIMKNFKGGVSSTIKSQGFSEILACTFQKIIPLCTLHLVNYYRISNLLPPPCWWRSGGG
jgi:hypothetical protein